MVGPRTIAALIGLAVGLLVSVLAWVYWDTLALFVFLPFVPFLFRRSGGRSRERPAVRECPSCGFRTRESEFEYCPRDGRRLEPVGDR